MKRIKNLATLCLAATTAAGCLFLPAKSVRADGVEINEENFPDSQFRYDVAFFFDDNKDNYLDDEEIANAISLNLSNDKIDDFTGIEYLTNLIMLNISKCYPTVLDLSGNVNLTTLDCSDNQLNSLDLSNNTELVSLNCKWNDLFDLDLSNNTKLKTVNADSNFLAHLDVTMLEDLVNLSVTSNILEELNVRWNSNLQYLKCNSNQLSGKLDLTNNHKLKTLDCSTNFLTTLELDCPELKELKFANNTITSLDLTQLPQLEYLDAYANQLEDIDFSYCPNLTHISIGRNYSCGASLLDLTHCSNLEYINLDSCEYKRIFFPDGPLKYINVSMNRIEEFYVGDQPNLEFLDCSFNNIKGEFDLSQNKKIREVYCRGNEISEFYTALINELEVLCVDGNKDLKYIDLRYCKNLYLLSASGCGFSSIDISQIPMGELNYTCERIDRYNSQIAYADSDFNSKNLDLYVADKRGLAGISVSDGVKVITAKGKLPFVTPTPNATPTPTATPSKTPSSAPTSAPTSKPTVTPTSKPGSTVKPTVAPTSKPGVTSKPTAVPTSKPGATVKPTNKPTSNPTGAPGNKPTTAPVNPGVTSAPSATTVPGSTNPTSAPSVTSKPGATVTPDKPVSTDTPTAAPSVTAKPSKPQTGVSDKAGTVEDFAERLYTTCLGRDSEEAGKDFWVSELKGGKPGSEVAQGFFFSPEFVGFNLDNEEYITRLYRTFMGREPDQAGIDYWSSEMEKGMDRKFVFDGFVNSPEWADICLTYGIRSGGLASPTFEKDASPEVLAFAERLYTTCLGRKAEEAGLKYWSQELANLRQTGTAAAAGFFYSPEFIGLNTSDDEYVTRLYRTFMGREPEEAGFEFWTEELKAGKDRQYVFDGFSAAPEFAGLCAEAGILR